MLQTKLPHEKFKFILLAAVVKECGLEIHSLEKWNKALRIDLGIGDCACFSQGLSRFIFFLHVLEIFLLQVY